MHGLQAADSMVELGSVGVQPLTVPIKPLPKICEAFVTVLALEGGGMSIPMRSSCHEERSRPTLGAALESLSTPIFAIHTQQLQYYELSCFLQL